MNEWQPIETYDKLKTKPKFAVFYVDENKDQRNYRGPGVVTVRYYGSRTISHWCELPDTP